MGTMERTRNRVKAIMAKFPSEVARFSRPVLDRYGQPAGDTQPLGEAVVWRKLPELPESWRAALAGQTYEDRGPIWICAPWRADLPQVRCGDICTLNDGMERTVRNVQNRGNVRVFWQLWEV